MQQQDIPFPDMVSHAYSTTQIAKSKHLLIHIICTLLARVTFDLEPIANVVLHACQANWAHSQYFIYLMENA